LYKPKPEYIKSLDNILFGFGLSKLGKISSSDLEEIKIGLSKVLSIEDQ
jgi:hypothetical protein